MVRLAGFFDTNPNALALGLFSFFCSQADRGFARSRLCCTGRHWIGGERGGKGGAMRAYQKWFWRDSIFSCDR